MVKQLCHFIPIYTFKEGFDVCFLVSVVLVKVGMLPKVNAKNRLVLRSQDSVHHRVIFIVSCNNSQNLLFVIDAKPDPTWELSSQSCLKDFVS